MGGPHQFEGGIEQRLGMLPPGFADGAHLLSPYGANGSSWVSHSVKGGGSLLVPEGAAGVPKTLTDEQKARTCIVAGSSHPDLAHGIAEEMGIDPDKVILTRFSDGELRTEFKETIRGRRVIIVQTGGSRAPSDEEQLGFDVNATIMQTLFIGDAVHRAGGKHISLVMPYFPYGRQDRLKGRESIAVATVLKSLQEIGYVEHIMTSDMHAPASQGAFDHQLDMLTGMGGLSDALKEILKQYSKEDIRVVAPDMSAAGVADILRNEGLGLPHPAVPVPKKRDEDGIPTHVDMSALEALRGKVAVMFDDMIDTFGTMMEVIEALFEVYGVRDVIVATTHGVLSGKAIERIVESKISKLVVTNTLPQDRIVEAMGPDRVQVVDMAPLIGRALIEVVTEGSVSSLLGMKARR